MDDLKKYIREIPDFPKAGINFFDITTLLKHPSALKATLDRFADLFAATPVDSVVGIESRGFLFGVPLAYKLGAGFVPVRKPGKLPAATVSATYELEYGVDRLEMHQDAISKGDRVLIIDDVIATGGTAAATAELVEQSGGEIVALGFVIELSFLNGRSKLGDRPVQSLLSY